MTTLDAIAYAVNVENQGSNLVGAHASGVGSLTLDSVYNFPATGSVDIDGDTYAYTAVDEETNTLDLSGTTSGAYADGDRVELSPPAPVWFATVVVGSDQPGFNAMVPIHLVPFLAQGFWAEGIPVRLESIEAGEYQWQVVATPGQQPVYDATSAPIIITNEFGEAARLGAEGLEFTTNDFPERGTTIVGTFTAVAGADGFIFVRDSASDIRKYDAATGVENLSGFPIVGTYSHLAVADGFVYAIDAATSDIRKFDATTGVENLSGFPIAGTFNNVAAADGFVYALEAGTNDVRKYDATTGVQNVSGFPIVGTFSEIAVSNGFVYAISSNDVRKFDATTGAESVAGFPLPGGNYFRVAAADGFVYVIDSDNADVRKFEAETGTESLAGFPIVGTFDEIAAQPGYVHFKNNVTSDIDTYTYPENFRSMYVDASTGVLYGAGQASLSVLGHSNQRTLTANATPTSTTNVNLTDLSMTFTTTSVNDVVWVDCDAAVTIGVANTINIIELLIDGVAQAKQLWTRASAINNIIAGYKRWRLTGLTPGIHTIAFRTRNTAGATSATINADQTSASYWTST